MSISALIAVGLPVAIFLIWRKKYNLKIIPMLFGIIAFVMFALVFEQILHSFVLRPNPDGSIGLLTENPALFILYAIFAAGVFEETARFISFHILKRRFDGIGTGLSYGIGHGGIEAILIAGLAMVSNILMSVTINSGNAAILGNDPAVFAQINTMINTSPALFLASGFERIIAVSVHISLSMLVWCSVKVKGKLWLYPAAILLHAVVNLAPAFYQAGIIQSIWLIEVLIIIPAALVAYFAYRVCMIMQKEDISTTTAEDKTEREKVSANEGQSK